MKNLLLLFCVSFTLGLNAQKIINSNPFTTAGGDLRGTYPNPQVGVGKVGSVNITTGLRDSIQRFRHDTTIYHIVDGNVNYGFIINTLGRYNRVSIIVLGETGFAQGVVMPSGSDTIRNTEFNITYLAEDTTSSLQIAAFDGFALFYSPPTISDGGIVLRSLAHGKTATLRVIEQNGAWFWMSSVSQNIYLESIGEGGTGITAGTGDVTFSGTGSVTTTIAADAVTSAKILNGTIVSADIANQTVDSLDIKNGVITTVKIATDAVTSSRVLDNSLTGSDLTYLTLRAGTTSNASLQLTPGSDKTTLTGGEILYNGSRVAVGIGSNKRRIPVTNDVSPSNGQIPIGNGSDYTVANITAGTGLTVTNGSGSITVGETVAKVASVSMVNADVDISTQVNSTLITHVNGYYSTGLYTITIPVPSASLVGRMIIVNVNATAIGNGYLINSASGSNEFWGVNPTSNPTNFAPAAFASDGWNVSLYTTVTYTCRQINSTYYWVRDTYFDTFWGQSWKGYKTAVTGTTLTFTEYVPDGAYVQEKLRLYKNGLFMIPGVDYTATDNYPAVTVTLTDAAISGDKWYFTYQY